MGSGLSASRSPGMTAIAGRASAKDSLAERLKPSLPAAPARAPERRRRRRRDEGREERDGAGKPQLDLPESALSLPATRFTHVGFSLLPPPARRSRVAGRGRGGGWLGEARGRRGRGGGWARAAFDARARSPTKHLGKRPPPRSGFARVGPPRHSASAERGEGGARRRPSMRQCRSLHPNTSAVKPEYQPMFSACVCRRTSGVSPFCETKVETAAILPSFAS